MSRSVANSRKGSAFVHSRRAPFILWPVGMTSPRPLQWKAVALQIRPKVRAERIVCRATRALEQMQFLAANAKGMFLVEIIQVDTGRPTNRASVQMGGPWRQPGRLRRQVSSQGGGWKMSRQWGECEDPWFAVHLSPSLFVPTRTTSSPVTLAAPG